MKTETLVGLTVLLAALLSVGAYQAGVGLSGSHVPVLLAAQPAGTPVTVSADGPALFAANCAGCHGTQAQGAVGPKLAELPWTVSQFAQAVREGQAPAGRALAPMMPHFRTAGFDGKPPTDGQLTAVLTFLKKL